MINWIIPALTLWLASLAGPVAVEPTPAPAPDAAAVICAPEYAWDCSTALGIVECESGFDAYATGAAGERSWWQIHPVHAGNFDWSRAYEPAVNTAYAYDLWLEAGWSAWSCQP